MKAENSSQKPTCCTLSSINGGLVGRIVTLSIVKARDNRYLRRLWRLLPGISTLSNVYIKVKPYEFLGEAHAMQFVSQHTSIPVPNIYCAFIHKGLTYTVMSKIKGHMVMRGWVDRSAESRAKILDQLGTMVAELRAIKPPVHGCVSGIHGGPFWDCRLPEPVLRGPFETTRDFHVALVNGIGLDTTHDNLGPDVAELFAFYRQSEHDVVFTHGDLSCLNVIVQDDEVVGIIDWETAGWFPAYWEYVCGKNVNPLYAPWAQEVDRFLTPMPHELSMDRIRLRYFGPF